MIAARVDLSGEPCFGPPPHWPGWALIIAATMATQLAAALAPD